MSYNKDQKYSLSGPLFFRHLVLEIWIYSDTNRCMHSVLAQPNLKLQVKHQ